MIESVQSGAESPPEATDEPVTPRYKRKPPGKKYLAGRVEEVGPTLADLPPLPEDPATAPGILKPTPTPTGSPAVAGSPLEGRAVGKIKKFPSGLGMAQPPREAPAEPLPRPLMFDFTPDPGGFFKYWATLPADRVIVYAYRNWPVCDPMLTLTPEEQEKVRRKELRLVTNIAKLVKPWDHKYWEQEIYHCFGSGDFHFKLNDSALKKAIAMVSVKGLRDFDNYPPVLDKRGVVMSDPANSSYIERMRLKGMRFPGDPGAEEDEDMSGTTEAMREMANTITGLADRVITQGNKPTPPPGPDPKAAGELRAVEAVAEGARQGMNFLGEAMKTVQAASAKAADPKEYLRDVMEMGKILTQPSQPQGGFGMEAVFAQMMAMQKQMMDMQQASNQAVMEQMKDRLAFTERMAADANSRVIAASTPLPAANPQSATGVAPGAPVITAGAPSRSPSMLDELEKLLTLKDRLDSLGGGGADGPPGWVPYALQGLSILATAGTNIAYNIAAAKAGSAAAPPPPMPTGIPGAMEDEADPGPDQGANGMPNALPNPTPGGTDMNPTVFAQRLHGPLVKALNDGIPGYEFGARMIIHEGAMVYTYLANQGKERLISLMQLHPPLWGDLIRFGAHVETFLDEFLDQGAAMEMAEELRAGGPPPPQPIPAPRARQTATAAPPTQGAKRTVVRGDGTKVEVMAPGATTGPVNSGAAHQAPVINIQPGEKPPAAS